MTLSFAMEDGEPVGALLHVIGADRMYVRNWGCRPGHPFLHFEVCYYRLIEQAIALGCSAIEGGYGGVHKLARVLPAQIDPQPALVPARESSDRRGG